MHLKWQTTGSPLPATAAQLVYSEAHCHPLPTARSPARPGAGPAPPPAQLFLSTIFPPPLPRAPFRPGAHLLPAPAPLHAPACRAGPDRLRGGGRRARGAAGSATVAGRRSLGTALAGDGTSDRRARRGAVRLREKRCGRAVAPAAAPPAAVAGHCQPRPGRSSRSRTAGGPLSRWAAAFAGVNGISLAAGPGDGGRSAGVRRSSLALHRYN